VRTRRHLEGWATTLQMPQRGLRLERSRPQVGGEPSAHRQRQTSARDSRSGKSVGRPLQLSRVVGVATYRSCTWPGASMGTNLYRHRPEAANLSGLSCHSETCRSMLSAHIASFLSSSARSSKRHRSGYTVFIMSTTSTAELRTFYRFSNPTTKLAIRPINSPSKPPVTSRAMIWPPPGSVMGMAMKTPIVSVLLKRPSPVSVLR